MNTWGALFSACAATALLAACGSNATSTMKADGVTRIVASDGSVSLPEGTWTAQDAPGSVVLALQDSVDESRQLIVTSFADTDEAEEHAIVATTGLAGDDVVCERTSLDGRLAFDCPFSFEGVDYHKVFVVLDGDAAALALFQVAADSKETALAELGSVLAGGRRKDGTAL